MIGKDCVIGKGAMLQFSITVGEKTHIMNCSQITEFSEIGKNVFIGPDVSMSSDPSFARGKVRLKRIVIKDNARVGNNATLVPGVTIGKNALVAAGSVVLGDVPSGKVVLGNPAKVVWKAK